MPLHVLPESRHNSKDFTTDLKVYEGLWRMEDRHFWHDARNGWILKSLRQYKVMPPAEILEVGCGSGAVVRALALAGYQVTGLDTSEPLVRKAHERCPTANLVAGDVASLPEKLRGPYDAVGLFDVLEHVDDPVQLLRQSVRWARPGALVIVTVPAIRALFSVVDELACHKLRYELGEVARVMESAGIRDVREHGIFRATLPLLRLSRAGKQTRKLADLSDDEQRDLQLAESRVPAAPVNAALRLLCAAERRLAFGSALAKIGPTMLAVGRVP